MQEAERFMGSNDDNSGNMGGDMDRQREGNTARNNQGGGDMGGGRQQGGSSSGGGFGGAVQSAETAGAMG